MIPDNDPSEMPLYEPGEQETYTLDIVARLSGVSSQTILHYQEQGLLRDADFDDESLHTLRMIEHLRSTCEANLTGLKLILDLISQVEQLKTALRAKR